MDEAGRSTSLDEFEERTLSHFHKMKKLPTPWISTSPSLSKVLPYLIQFDPRDGIIFVIRVKDCEDIYDAPEVTWSLPGIRDILENKWGQLMDYEGKTDEYVIFGKVPRKAIAATISGPELMNCQALRTIAPSLAQAIGLIDPTRQLIIINSSTPKGISKYLIKAAIELVSKFEGADEYTFFWIVRVLLGSDFDNPYRERRDGQTVREAIEGFLCGTFAKLTTE